MRKTPSKTHPWQLTNGRDTLYFKTLMEARTYAQVYGTGISIIQKLN